MNNQSYWFFIWNKFLPLLLVSWLPWLPLWGHSSGSSFEVFRVSLGLQHIQRQMGLSLLMWWILFFLWVCWGLLWVFLWICGLWKIGVLEWIWVHTFLQIIFPFGPDNKTAPQVVKFGISWRVGSDKFPHFCPSKRPGFLLLLERQLNNPINTQKKFKKN